MTATRLPRCQGFARVVLGGALLTVAPLWPILYGEAARGRGIITLWIGAALMLAGTARFSKRPLSSTSQSHNVIAILGVGVALRIGVAWWPPWLSDDVFRYLWDGMLLSEGVNPFAFVPSDTALEAWQSMTLYARLNSSDFYSVYPPLTQLAFLGPGWLTKTVGWEAGYAGWKVLTFAVEVGGLAWAGSVLAPRAFVWIAWNPLFVIELSGQAHTEALLWPLLIVVLSRSRSTSATASALGGAILLKLTPILLVPELLRRPRREALRAAGILAVLAVAALTTFGGAASIGHAAESLQLYTRYFEFNAGPYYALKGALFALTGDDWSKQLGPALATAALVGIALVWWRALTCPERWPLRRAALWAFALPIALATTVHPWYLVPVIVVLAVRHDAGETGGAAAWHWLALLSLATYARYVDGPYALAVALGWMGWAALLARDAFRAHRTRRPHA